MLINLKDLGNSVVIVEHEEEIIRAADEIIDIGPGAGRLGGELVFQGTFNEMISSNNGLTARYLRGDEKIDVPPYRRKSAGFIEIRGAAENNLKNIDVKIPLGIMTVITGVSGSGKSSLIKNILYPVLANMLNGAGEKPGRHDGVSGDLHLLTAVEMVDQNPIGKSTRSNPVTYIKAFDEIRKLFAGQQLSKNSGFGPSHFSFNVDGGRCEECQGEGIIRVEMQFMADIYLECDSCHGRRFKDDVLEVTYRGKNIFDILESTVDEAIEFFGSQKGSLEKTIARKLQPLSDTGLGYVSLGQSSSTLSGGESQRVKLASFLGADKTAGPVLFIIDEPPTGLHFHDIRKLLDAFNELIAKGHSILIIEHNMEVIKSATMLSTLGPAGVNRVAP